MTADSDRWIAALAFAELLRTGFSNLAAPIVGASGAGDLTTIRTALVTFSRWWRTDYSAPPLLLPWSAGSTEFARISPVICGPIIVLPPDPFSTGGDSAAALVWAVTMARCTHLHPYGIGLSAASSSYPWLSPPVYQFGVTSWRTGLTDLANLWRHPPIPTEAQHTAKAALVASDPARHRCLHPSLLASTLITT